MSEMMSAALAALPILAILVLMIGFRWPAARAGSAGLGLTLVLSAAAFGYGTQVYPEAGFPRAASGAMTEALFVAVTILWIVFPALCIHHLQERTGALDVQREFMRWLSPDPRIAAVAVAWFFALFMEGAAGFGTPVALAAPFLVSMGFRPVEAVALPLIGHSVGVSFGAVGTPVRRSRGRPASITRSSER
jgi:lactate permease